MFLNTAIVASGQICFVRSYRHWRKISPLLSLVFGVVNAKFVVNLAFASFGSLLVFVSCVMNLFRFLAGLILFDKVNITSWSASGKQPNFVNLLSSLSRKVEPDLLTYEMSIVFI